MLEQYTTSCPKISVIIVTNKSCKDFQPKFAVESLFDYSIEPT